MAKTTSFCMESWNSFKKSSFVESFKEIDKRVFLSAVIDIALLFSIYLLFKVVTMSILSMGEPTIDPLNPSLEQLTSTRLFLIKFSLHMIFMFIFSVALWSTSRYFIFKQLYKHKFSWNILWKMQGIGFVSISLFFAIYILLSKIVLPSVLPFFALIMITAFAFKMNILLTLFFKEGKFIESFQNMFKVTFGRAKCFIDWGVVILWAIISYILLVSAPMTFWYGLLLVIIFLAFVLYLLWSQDILASYFLGYITIMIFMILVNWPLSLLNFTGNTFTEGIISLVTIAALIFSLAWLRNLIVIVARNVTSRKKNMSEN